MKLKVFFQAIAMASIGVSMFVSQDVSAAKLEVDAAHSSITFEVKHLKVAKIPGRFSQFSGTIDLNEKDITKSKVDFTVDVASIYTGVDKRDEHLRSADFFDAKKHPKATFKSTKITKKDDNELVLEGNLRIRGKTKKVKFEVEQLGKAQDPTSNTEKFVFKAEGEINRKDFGVNYGPDEVVSDKVELDINLETVAKK